MAKKSVLLLLFVSAFLPVFGQMQIITGTVTGADSGMPLPGVSVVALDKTGTGTITNLEGKYSIELSPSSTALVFSFIGMKTKTLTMGSSTHIDVVLEEDVLGLEEVVVTALGIKKDKKSLGYAVESVQGKKLRDGNQSNVINALQGKVAGVSIVNSGGAPGASSVIMIRGGSSLSQNNQPLMIVDGIPIDNTTEAGSLIASSNRGLDMNSEDIESVTVLKGPAAAALYGIEAANGAIIITTKSGKAGQSIITYNGSYSIDNVMSVPEVQTKYGQGDQRRNGSINLVTTESWNLEEIPEGAPIYHNIRDFYQTAYTTNNNLSYSGGTNNGTMYFSLGRLDQNGVVGNTGYERNSFKLKAKSSIKKTIDVSASINYVNSVSQRTRQGSASSGSFHSLLNYPANINMKDYVNEDGSPKEIEGFRYMAIDNPYWSALNNPVDNVVDRYIGIASASYAPTKFMDFTYRVGSDLFMERNHSHYATGSAMFLRVGYLSEYEVFNRILTATFLMNLNHSIAKNNFGLLLGNNIEDKYRRRMNWSGEGFIEPDFVGINNILEENRSISQDSRRKRIVSAFTEFKYDWNSKVFMNATYRFDKTSTIAQGNNMFGYPSVGLSVLASDILSDMDFHALNTVGINYWKFRTTWAQVGKDAPPHVLETPMASSTNTYTIDPQGFIRAVYPTGNPALVPEYTTTFEVGSDLRMFGNRLGVDFSYYISNTSNQILFVRMSPSTGTYGGYMNAGSVNNKGFELLLSSKPVKTKNFNWELDVNFTKSKSIVTDLPGEIKQVEQSDAWAYNNVAQGAAILNSTVFGIYGFGYVRDNEGTLLLGTDGMPVKDNNKKELGDRYPDWTSGISNNLSYKNVTLNFLWDISYGNDVLNATKAALVYYGLDPMTLNRGESGVIEGLRSTGVLGDDGKLVYEPNDMEVVFDQAYYQNNYAAIGENFVEDGSWIRMRHISLSYRPPSKWFKDKIKNAQLSVTGRNLLLFTKYTGIDPEINTIGAAVMGSGSIGIDNLGTPSTKGVDFSLKFSF